MLDCAATIRFARVRAAALTLAELAAGPEAGRLAEVLAGDELVLARMRAAAEVVRAAGMPVDLADDRAGDDELLGRAAAWQQYAAGPVSPLHEACGRDIARGMLRLWARRTGAAGDNATRPAARLRQTRVESLSRVRTRCAALRTELRDDAASLRRCGTSAFADHAMRRVDELASELQETLDWEFGMQPGPAVKVDLPPPRTADLENRLALVVGVGFGAGMTLTVARLLSEALPAWGAAPPAAAAVAGLALGGWVVRTRRVLCRRAALDRWLVEVTAGLRAALEDHVVSRAVAADGQRVNSSPVRD